jgi:hypothetical protein
MLRQTNKKNTLKVFEMPCHAMPHLASPIASMSSETTANNRDPKSRAGRQVSSWLQEGGFWSRLASQRVAVWYLFH